MVNVCEHPPATKIYTLGLCGRLLPMVFRADIRTCHPLPSLKYVDPGYEIVYAFQDIR